MNDPNKGIKDSMWWFLMKHGQRPNVSALEENVNNLIEMTTQKTAGQRKVKNDIDWIELEPTIWSIVIEATALVLSGDLNKLEEKTCISENQLMNG